jgi:Tfp pilus assembly protein PilW
MSLVMIMHMIATRMQSKSRPAVSLVELLVAVIVSSILVTVTVQIYGAFRQGLVIDQARASITQNARIAMDRITRELRQSPALRTELPDNPADTTVAQPGEIEFEDGHANNLTYKRYFLNGTTLQMQIKEYYFSGSPSVRVHWNQTGTGGSSPTSAVISTQDVADNVGSVAFYGDTIVQIVITTTDGGNQRYVLTSSVTRRN